MLIIIRFDVILEVIRTFNIIIFIDNYGKEKKIKIILKAYDLIELLLSVICAG